MECGQRAMSGRGGDQEDVLELRDHPTSAGAPADRSLAARQEHTPSLLPNSFLEEKETMLLAPQTLQSHVSRNPRSLQKKGEPKQVVNFSSSSRGEVFSL